MNLAFEVEALGRRESFNKVVGHAKSVIEIVGEIESGYNLADVVNEMIDEQRLENGQVGPIVSSLLLDKYNYRVMSFNLTDSVTDFGGIAAEMARWSAVDLVVMYFHPELGVKIVNPKRAASWQLLQNLKKNELVNIYAGAIKGEPQDAVKETAIQTCIALLSGQKSKAPSALLKGTLKVKERRPVRKEAEPERQTRTQAGRKPSAARQQKKTAAAAPGKEEGEGQKRMTPFYSIPVTNELFHNGNVEAWKKIIESYQTKYPNSDVYIFYEGERIHDINTLFKWGKVKHGSSILIAVAGNMIKDVAKLQRYLRQGASPMFEAFLKFPVNHILNLF
ncbi:MAG TPA: hypothetical protein ENN69_07135 [Spirochaetia bacterium]|nr:hypothetical protein [Spirochaetia bacterium]